MKKISKYDAAKVYMFPSGELATPERVAQEFPAIQHFAHMIETDEAGEVLFAVQNLAAMRSLLGIDPTMTEEEAIAAIEAIVNAPSPEPGATAEERIAAMLEYQTMMML